MATEKRLIDANEMKNNIMEAMMRQFEKNSDQMALRIAEMMWHFIDVTDTVDAVEVVRCQNCIYYDPEFEFCALWHKTLHPEHYCGEGKVDENATD